LEQQRKEINRSQCQQPKLETKNRNETISFARLKMINQIPYPCSKDYRIFDGQSLRSGAELREESKHVRRLVFAVNSFDLLGAGVGSPPNSSFLKEDAVGWFHSRSTRDFLFC
jgi:hypothetical protein